MQPSAGLVHPISVNHEIENHAMPSTSFPTDIQTLRKRARQHIDEGPVTVGYSADRKIVLKLLNDSMATELVCVCAIGAITSWREVFIREAWPRSFSTIRTKNRDMPTRSRSA
jgi:hypothetical protein